MRSSLGRWLVLVAVLVSLFAGGSVSAEPEPDRVCVFGGYAPYAYFDECLDVPSYPVWFPDPITPEPGEALPPQP